MFWKLWKLFFLGMLYWLTKKFSVRKAGGLHTEEAVKAKVIVRPETTEEVFKNPFYLQSGQSAISGSWRFNGFSLWY